MKKLSKEEMKTVVGGVVPPGGGGCAIVYSDQGQSSCYFTYNAYDLCQRVYGSHCEATSNGYVDCVSNGCTMN